MGAARYGGEMTRVKSPWGGRQVERTLESSAGICAECPDDYFVCERTFRDALRPLEEKRVGPPLSP
jgi:hypothetical protein